MSATALRRCFSVNRFCECNIFSLYHSSIHSDMFYKVGPLKKKTYMKTPVPEFFSLDKVAYHQACNFIKKRLQHRCFTVNFAKLLKALCRTPQENVSNFNSTFLTLRLQEDVYRQQDYFFLIFLRHLLSFIDARNKSIWL